MRHCELSPFSTPRDTKGCRVGTYRLLPQGQAQSSPGLTLRRISSQQSSWKNSGCLCGGATCMYICLYFYMRSCVVGQKTPIKMIKTCIYFATEPPPLLRVSMTRVLQPVGSQILPHAKASELNYGLETFTNTTPPYSRILTTRATEKTQRLFSCTRILILCVPTCNFKSKAFGIVQLWCW